MQLFKLILFFISLFIFQSVNAKNINFNGLKKLNINDISTLTNIDLFRDDYSLDEVNSIVKDLYNSDLVNDVILTISEDTYFIEIIESSLIKEIFINGNIKIKDEDLLANLQLKPNLMFNQEKVKKDIDTIKKIYLSEGYYNISVNISYEKYSEDKINLIYDIFEGNPYQISYIEFVGNKFFQIDI